MSFVGMEGNILGTLILLRSLFYAMAVTRCDSDNPFQCSLISFAQYRVYKLIPEYNFPFSFLLSHFQHLGAHNPPAISTACSSPPSAFPVVPVLRVAGIADGGSRIGDNSTATIGMGQVKVEKTY